jgi:hypothetical protein
MPVSLISWKVIKRNSLRGFAKVRLGKALIISDVAVHCSHGKRWAQLPSKPLIDANGNAKRADNGKIQYVPLMEWGDRETSDSFSNGVLDAVEREHPGATQADAA